MTGTLPSQPRVSIVVNPRERFSVALPSLESLLAHSEPPYQLIYVDCGSPRRVHSELQQLAAERGFELIRTDHYLPTNAARNLGIRRARGDYVVFVENDVIVSPGWLPALVDCADATGATVVSPLICGGTPLHREIHCAGGVCGVEEMVREGRVQRFLYERIARQGQDVGDVGGELSRCETGLAEFHCMLVRRSHFQQHGPLDERVLNTREHVDFCMSVAERGGSVWLEPASRVTYLYDAPMQLSDLPYFAVRWSDRWERASLEYLCEKYRLDLDAALRRRLQRIGWRRRVHLARPLARGLTGGSEGRITSWLEKLFSLALKRVDGSLGRWLHARNDRRAARVTPPAVPAS